ncbi:MAG: hypothetical protein ACRDOJ_14270 [Nocardioidaceae bacterium]
MSAEQSASKQGANPRGRAGVFDVRMIIGLLLGIYGVVLTITGWVGTSDSDLAKADGINVNLLTGIALIVAAGVFFVWARVRPLLVPDDPSEGESSGPPPD